MGVGSGSGYGGGVYRASDAIQQGDVSTNAFDDFFEYALAQPVTIHKNESAMVPILQQDLPASHVTLWSDSDATPLRAIWLENKSKLTLDSGSFSIFENGEFAGEGLLDPIHPGRKASAFLCRRPGGKGASRRGATTRGHCAISRCAKGVLVETTSEVTENTYTVNNAADETRAVVVEHAQAERCRTRLRCEAGRDDRNFVSLSRGRGAAPVRRPAREGARQPVANDRHPTQPFPQRVPG